MSKQLLDNTESAESSRVIAYDKAEVVPGFVNNTFFLIVSGEAPCANMNVQLQPRINVTCPDYWAIEVVGTLPGGFCLTAMKPFTISIPLSGITGAKGIEVVGGNRSETIGVSGGCLR